MSQTLPRAETCIHEVQLYETDDYLIASITDFIEEGLLAGEAGIVIASARHAIAVEDDLRCRGVDVDEARAEGRYEALDAGQTLATFMTEAGPDPARFEAIVGGAIARAQEGAAGVRAFGEMVSLLWADGDIAGALRLEELWNELGRKLPFRLMCGYPLSAFDEDSSGAFHRICELHERIVPTESFIRLPDDVDRLRAVSALQQRVSASVKERVQRDAERQYRQALQLNDALVQGLSAAKMAFELKDYETLDNVLSDTLQRASAIVSELLEHRVNNEGLTPGDLRR